jgi:hypothetical protein
MNKVGKVGITVLHRPKLFVCAADNPEWIHITTVR